MAPARVLTLLVHHHQHQHQCAVTGSMSGRVFECTRRSGARVSERVVRRGGGQRRQHHVGDLHGHGALLATLFWLSASLGSYMGTVLVFDAGGGRPC